MSRRTIHLLKKQSQVKVIAQAKQDQQAGLMRLIMLAAAAFAALFTFFSFFFFSFTRGWSALTSRS
jgi:hypothetical protein